MAINRLKVFKSLNNASQLIPHCILSFFTGHSVILPFYHAVSNKEMLHIKHLYPVKKINSFIEDLDYLLKHFDPIDISQFMDHASHRIRLKRPTFLLSFDDGLREFHDIIAPILLKKGVPAICFLNSAFIDNRDLFYRYKASLLIEYLKKNKEFHQKAGKVIGPSTDTEKFLMAISYADRSILDQLASSIDYSFDEFLKAREPYLTSAQIVSLIKQGFHFGAHSVDHPEYQHIPLSQQLRQTQKSVEDICSRFDLSYRVFAFPFTDYNVSSRFFSEINTQDISQCTFGCAGLKNDSAPNHFHRIPMEVDKLSAKDILKAESLYYLMKMPFGKNRIIRV